MKSYCFAALFLCLLAGCGGPTTRSQNFHLTVKRNPANNDHRQETTLTFHAPSKAEIIVEVGRDRDSVSFDAKTSSGNRECLVRLVAERQESQTDGKSNVKILVGQEMPNGDSAGGPSLYTVDAGKSLEATLDVTVAEGEFAFDRPVRLGTLNGVPVTLLVRRLDE